VPEIRHQQAANKIRGTFLIDGEAVVSNEYGVVNFEQLPLLRTRQVREAVDARSARAEWRRSAQAAPYERKSKLAKLLRASHHSGIVLGIVLNEQLEAHDSARAFAKPARRASKGIVSKRRDSRYVSGRSNSWVKVKNPRYAWCVAISGSGILVTFRAHRSTFGIVRGSGSRAIKAVAR
jgi:bifunctional non-homologous end joining protein LigD